MKGLLKYLSPFAPDQSGAVSVLYELGGILVICDAGGCTGNICGFDEPRWFETKSAIFSAGLRDMDAILGRDKRLVGKLKDAADRMEAPFAALIGTPVPAVIGTDFKALKRMSEKSCGIPTLAIDCTGTRLYDEGARDAYLELFQTFAEEGQKVVPGRIGVLGATPLDLSGIHGDRKIRESLAKEGWQQVYCYGMGDGLQAIREAGSAEKNLVLAPSGLKAARYLKKRFGTPYETRCPVLNTRQRDEIAGIRKKKVLVIHQQVMTDEIRRELREHGNEEVTAATWFLMDEELKEPQDLHLETEEQFARVVQEGRYEVIIGDQMLRRAVRDYKGQWIHVPHFAVSGELEDGA